MVMSPTLVLVTLSAVLASTVCGTEDPPDLLDTIPEEVIEKIFRYHLSHWKDCSSIVRTCKTLNGLVAPGLRDLRLVFQDNVTDTDMQQRLKKRKVEFQCQSPDHVSTYTDPYTALSLYDRFNSGRIDWAHDRLDIIRAMIRRIHPIIFGAVIATPPQTDQDLKDVLALVQSVPWSSMTFPDVPAQITDLVTEIVKELSDFTPAGLHHDLCEQVRRGLSHFGAPYDGIFPLNQLVAERLLHRCQYKFDILEEPATLLALAWRGIRIDATPWCWTMRWRPRSETYQYRVYRIDHKPESIFDILGQSLKDNTPKWTGHIHILLEHHPDIFRHLHHLLTLPLEKFPWPEFCQVFDQELQELQFSPPQSSLICKPLLKLASHSYTHKAFWYLADFLLKCTEVRDHADAEDLYRVVQHYVRYKAPTGQEFEEFLQRPLFCKLDYMETVWAVLQDPDYVGQLLPYFLQIPAVLSSLRTDRFQLLQDIVQRTMYRWPRRSIPFPQFSANVLEPFMDMKEFWVFLEKTEIMSLYVDCIGATFAVRNGDSTETARSVEVPQALLSAKQLPCWPQLVNCQGWKNGLTLLHWACYYDHQGAIEFLLNCEHLDRYCVDIVRRGPLYHYMEGQYALAVKNKLDKTPTGLALKLDDMIRRLPFQDPKYHTQIIHDLLHSAYCQNREVILSFFKLKFMQDALHANKPFLSQYASKYGREDLVEQLLEIGRQ